MGEIASRHCPRCRARLLLSDGRCTACYYEPPLTRKARFTPTPAKVHWLIALIIVGFIIVGGVTVFWGYDNRPRLVKFEVITSELRAPFAYVSYAAPSGNVNNRLVKLPFTLEFQARPGEPILVVAQSADSATVNIIAINMYVDGVGVRSSTGEGEFATASIRGTL